MNTEKMRAFCLSLPGTTEGVKWEDHLCFMVAEKMYLITGMEDNSNVSIKVSDEDFEELTERDGIEQARYLAKRQWVSIQKRNALRQNEWKEYIRKSYELVKAKLPKKLQNSLGN
jgi:predicted DNA-binding protein (MmcQ/YjbR family)